MKNESILDPTQMLVSPTLPLKRWTIHPNLNFATATNRRRLQKAYHRLNRLTVLHSAQVAGLNA